MVIDIDNDANIADVDGIAGQKKGSGSSSSILALVCKKAFPTLISQKAFSDDGSTCKSFDLVRI